MERPQLVAFLYPVQTRAIETNMSSKEVPDNFRGLVIPERS